MEEINLKIKNDICYETLKELSDEKLYPEYMKCKSVKNEINKLEKILNNYVSAEIKQKIIDEYILELIPSGTKGVIRCNKFNNIVKNKITELNLNKHIFEICFEKKNELYLTSEIPDCYILDKTCNKILIGMNQLDVWNGGHQLNRGYKYIENKTNDNCKLLCVVCNEIQFTRIKNKAYKLFKIGFENNTLCYLNNIENIINSYFKIITD